MEKTEKDSVVRPQNAVVESHKQQSNSAKNVVPSEPRKIRIDFKFDNRPLFRMTSYD